MAAVANIYTGFSLALSPYSGLMPLVFVGFLILHLVQGGFVGSARKRYGIPYPTMYAIAGTPRHYSAGMSSASKLAESLQPLITEDEAYHFNLVQRGHQNTVENLPIIFALLIGAWPFPIIAGVAGFVQILGRALYFAGYRQAAASRSWGAVFIYPSLLTLLGLNIATAIFFFTSKAPY